MKLLTVQHETLYLGTKPVAPADFQTRLKAASLVFSAPLAALIAGNALTRERAHTLGVERGLIRGEMR